jgi:hypothetical protein
MVVVFAGFGLRDTNEVETMFVREMLDLRVQWMASEIEASDQMTFRRIP